MTVMAAETGVARRTRGNRGGVTAFRRCG